MVTGLLKDYSARRKSAPRTGASGSSSSPGGWPTARTADAHGATYQNDNHDKDKPRLTLAGLSEEMWRTPQTTDVGTPPEKLTAADGGPPELGHRMYREGADGERINQTQSLELQTRLWATPQARDDAGGNPERHADPERKMAGNLNDQALVEKLWATPTASEGPKGGAASDQREGSESLTVQAADQGQWPTPAATDYKAPGQTNFTREDGRERPLSHMPLREQAVHHHPSEAAEQGWPTPQATDGDRAPVCHKGGNLSLPEAARRSAGQPSPSFLPAPVIGSGGPPSSGATPGSPPPSPRRRLNPCFVEWLMNLPLHWSDPERTASIDFARWATASSRWLGLLLSAYSSAAWASRQRTLFDEVEG